MKQTGRDKKRKVFKIALTGGIASGKSTVAKLFYNYNIPIIDADIIAKTLTQPNTSAYLKIKKHFGENICKENAIDRKALAKVIFNDPKERHWLENLLHPQVRKEMQKQIQLCKTPYCILVIPLLAETQDTKLLKMIDRVLLADIPKKEQLKRLCQRDKIPIAAAKKILEAQTTRQKRLKLADDVIKNVDSIESLEKAVMALHKKYSALVLDRQAHTP